MKYEVLSPAGNMEKLKTAVLYGANAVYFAGKNFGLRAFAGNFSREEIIEAVKYCHSHSVKAYVTVNIVAHNKDFEHLSEYLVFLQTSEGASRSHMPGHTLYLRSFYARRPVPQE